MPERVAMSWIRLCGGEQQVVLDIQQFVNRPMIGAGVGIGLVFSVADATVGVD